MHDLIAFLLLCLLYFPAEFTYLYLASPRYTRVFRGIQRNPAAAYDLRFAPLAYLAYVPAWYFLCVRDFVHGRATASATVLRAFVFAVAVYGCYNFTNRVTFAGWSMVVQDLAWGTACLTAVTAVLVYVVLPRLVSGS